MNNQNRVSFFSVDPRGRSESDWLDTLDFLVTALAEATSTYPHVGAYWCNDFPGHQSVSIIARVRSRNPLPGVESDYWEAALCFTGDGDRSYSDAFVFPFLAGRPVTGKGILELDAELDEFRRWQFVEGQFVERGWEHPDGPGEWAWIKKIGDEYPESLVVTLDAKEYRQGRPVSVSLTARDMPGSHLLQKQSAARISLIHANRNRENTNLYPWGNRPLRPGSRYVISVQDVELKGSTIQFDLTQFNIRGGWIPGRYHLALRVQNCRSPEDWSFSSDISEPFTLTIL